MAQSKAAHVFRLLECAPAADLSSGSLIVRAVVTSINFGIFLKFFSQKDPDAFLPGQPRGSGASRGGQAGDGCFGLAFELKGGTSLSKGFGIIHRFSEDIDIRIEPFDGLKVDTNPNHENPQHIDSRRLFFEKLREKINIPGITAVERDTSYDDSKLRNAGLRLRYENLFGSIAGLKDGILLEVGFDQTSPNRACTISSWIVRFAGIKELKYFDNRALEILCYLNYADTDLG
jgi:hypothetical protein